MHARVSQMWKLMGGAFLMGVALLLSVLPARGAPATTDAMTLAPQPNTCQLYPIALHAGSLVNKAPGTQFDVLNGTGEGNFGWLSWTGVTGSDLLVKSLTPPGDSSTYINPANSQDRVLTPGDWVRVQPGTVTSAEVRVALDKLKTIDIAVPVWDQTKNSGDSAHYRADIFARIRLLDYQLAKQARITARFLGYTGCGFEPTAEHVAGTTDEDTAVSLTLRAAHRRVTPLTFTLSAPAHGTLGAPTAPVCTTANGVTTCSSTVRYTPHANYHGADAWTFTVNDGRLTSAPATASITVRPVNDAPSAAVTPTMLVLDEDAPPQAIQLQGSDVETAAADLAFRMMALPQHGALKRADGAAVGVGDRLTGSPVLLHYTPHANYHGEDSFRFEVTDTGDGASPARSVEATVMTTVNAVNDAPSYTDAPTNTAQTIDEGAALAALQATDPDGDTLTFSLTGGTLPAGIALDANGAFSGTASSGAAGTYTITIAITDGHGGGAETTLAITVADTTAPTPAPEPVPNRPRGPLLAWGDNQSGQVGDGTTTDRPAPVAPRVVTDAVAVAAGEQHTLALTVDGTVWVWGDNDHRQLGTTTMPHSASPLAVAGVDGVVALAAGLDHNLALRSDGTVWTWGRGELGQLGTGSMTDSATPAQVIVGTDDGVEVLHDVIAIAAGSHTSLALKGDGTVWAWGSNGRGQLGNGGFGLHLNSAVQVHGLTNITALAAGLDHSLALRSDGTVWTWGANDNWQLGYAVGGGFSPLAKQVPDLNNVVAVGTTIGSYSAVVKTDGTLWTWGFNDQGQLGDGTTTSRMTPKPVLGINNVAMVTGGRGHMLAVTRDRSVWAWGRNGDGQLGDGTTTNRATPARVTGVDGALDAAAGYTHSVIVAGDGTILEPDPATCTPGFLRGQYIVVFTDAVTDPQAVANDLVAQLGLTVTHVYDTALRGFAGAIPDASLQAVRTDARVAFVEQDQGACATAVVADTAPPVADTAATTSAPFPTPSVPNPRGVRRIGASADGVHQTLEHKGTGVGVAVFDTGIDYHHEKLVDAVSGGTSCVPGTRSWDDNHGHGTMVASLIAGHEDGNQLVGLAPNADLYAVKVQDQDGWGEVAWTVCGVDWVTKHTSEVQVASLSLRWTCDTYLIRNDCSNPTEDPEALQTAIQGSTAAGITYVVAAGNDGVRTDYVIPARYPEVITVSALADFDGLGGGMAGVTDDTLANFSNYGSAVDIAAPGTELRVAVPRPPTNGTPCALCNAAGYDSQGGTSLATPLVAAAAALYIEEHPGATPEAVKKHLLTTAEPGPIKGDRDNTNESKEGILDLRPPRLYVPNGSGNAVLVLDPDTLATMRTIEVPHRVGKLVVSPNRAYLYVTHPDTNSVSAINTVSEQVEATVALAAEPQDVAVSANSRWVYVTIVRFDWDVPANNIHRVAVLDATTHTLHREIVTGTYPIGITIDPAGRVYIANAGYVQHGGSTVTRITTDPVTQMPTAYTTMDNPYFTGVQYAATSPDGGYVYLSKGDGSIVGLNMETDRLDRYGWTGLGDAGSIAVSPNSQWLYIAARTKDFAKTGIVVADSRALDRLPHTFIPLPLVVDDLIVAPTGNKLYAVANAYKTGENGHALYVIDTRSNTVVQTQLLPGNVTGLALLP